jgi:single-strand DNA-binding protein
MPNLNRTQLMGNVTRDPELKYTPKGTAIASFAMAINRSWKTETGEKREEVLFLNCEAIGKIAEIIGQYVKKGNPIYVDGRLKLDQWEKDGQKHERMKVIVENMQLLGGKREEEAVPAQQSAPVRQGAKPVKPTGPDPDLDVTPDDLPF